jgi:hypothetical protein
MIRSAGCSGCSIRRSSELRFNASWRRFLNIVRVGRFCVVQREICRIIREGGGDYFFTMKDNQSALKADIALAFGPAPPLSGMVAAA